MSIAAASDQRGPISPAVRQPSTGDSRRPRSSPYSTPRSQSGDRSGGQPIHPFFLHMLDEVKSSKEEIKKVREELKPDIKRLLQQLNKLEESYKNLSKVIEDNQEKSFSISGSTFQVNYHMCLL